MSDQQSQQEINDHNVNLPPIKMRERSSPLTTILSSLFIMIWLVLLLCMLVLGPTTVLSYFFIPKTWSNEHTTLAWIAFVIISMVIFHVTAILNAICSMFIEKKQAYKAMLDQFNSLSEAMAKTESMVNDQLNEHKCGKCGNLETDNGCPNESKESN